MFHQSLEGAFTNCRCLEPTPARPTELEPPGLSPRDVFFKRFWRWFWLWCCLRTTDTGRLNLCIAKVEHPLLSRTARNFKAVRSRIISATNKEHGLDQLTWIVPPFNKYLLGLCYICQATKHLLIKCCCLLFASCQLTEQLNITQRHYQYIHNFSWCVLLDFGLSSRKWKVD